MKPTITEFAAPKNNNTRLQNLCEPLDENLCQIEQALDVTISRRGGKFTVWGVNARGVASALKTSYDAARDPPSIDDIQLGLVETRQVAVHGTYLPESDTDEPDGNDLSPALHTRRTDLHGRTPIQRACLCNVLSHDLLFGIGPTGTGKTYLAVAYVVDALKRNAIKRIMLTRPAMEAGERLGFLPGNLAQRVDPYLRPLYDALCNLLDFDKTQKMFGRQMIEIVPLAHIRGCTLNHAFIILDEVQNTALEQMKMFLTWIDFGSEVMVTGDVVRIDLPCDQESNLIEAQHVLRDIRGATMTCFTSVDVVRYPLVTCIVKAYDGFHVQHKSA